MNKFNLFVLLSSFFCAVLFAEEDNGGKPLITDAVNKNKQDNASMPSQSNNNKNIEEIIILGDDELKTQIAPETEQLITAPGSANDPLRAIFAFSSVTFSDGWDTNDPVIRGSAPSDNGYYIDGMPASYVYHVFGNSIFNKNLIYRFDFFPAGFDIGYNNVTGGVIDVSLRDPVNQPFTTTLNWSFLSASALVESRINDEMAFYASFRKSLLREYDELVDLKGQAEGDGFAVTELPADQDYQLKYVYNINAQHQLSLQATGALDDLGAEFTEGNNLVARDPDFEGNAKINRGFDNQSIRWIYQNQGHKVSTQVSQVSNFLNSTYGSGQYENIDSDELNLRSFWQFQWLERHNLELGFYLNKIDYNLDVNAKIPTCNQNLQADCPTVDAPRVNAKEALSIQSRLLYFKDSITIARKHILSLGIQLNNEVYFDELAIEPRLRWDYLLNEHGSFWLSAGQYSQRPELYKISTILGNPNLALETAQHYVFGTEWQFGDGYLFKSEVYYKNLENLVIDVQGDQESIYQNQAEGRAYGIEFLLKKNLTTNWYGWASLGLAKTERTNLATQEDFDFTYDKPVIFNLLSQYQLTDRWQIGFKWNYQTGGRYTPIIGLQESINFPDTKEPIYGEYNAERLPDYHQLDIRVEYNSPKSWGYWEFYVDLLNAYNRKNISGYRYAPNNKETIKPPKGFADDIPVSASTELGIIPSIGFEIQF